MLITSPGVASREIARLEVDHPGKTDSPSWELPGKLKLQYDWSLVEWSPVKEMSWLVEIEDCKF